MKPHVFVISAIVFFYFCLSSTQGQLPSVIRIVGLFESDDEKYEIAFRNAVIRANRTLGHYSSRLVAHIERINKRDSHEAARRVCQLMEMGIAGVFGPESSEVGTHVESLCDAYDIPHIQIRWDYLRQRPQYSLNFYPHPDVLSRAMDEIRIRWDWKNFTVIYENNDGLIRMKDLLNFDLVKEGNEQEYHIRLRQLSADGNYRAMFRDMIAGMEYKIFLDCSNDKLFTVLKQAQQVGMMTENHWYFITNLDLHTFDLEDFKYGGTVVTGMRLVDPESRQVKQVANDWSSVESWRWGVRYSDTVSINTELALTFDAVDVFVKALLTVGEGQDLETKELSCKTTDYWTYGDSIVNQMKHVRTSGLTGTVKFEPDGFRRSMYVDIVSLTENGLKTIGNWSIGMDEQLPHSVLHLSPNRPGDEAGEENKRSISGRHLIVTTALSAPYTLIRETSESKKGNERYEGYAVDLIDELAQLHKFTYEIKLVADGKYGNKHNETHWNGMIGEVLAGKADIAIVDLTITEERQTALDFTNPFMTLGIGILYVKPTKQPPQFLSFLAPFAMEVWAFMAMAYLGVSIVLYLLARINPSEWDNPYPCIEDPDELVNCFTFGNSLWFTIGSLMQQGSDIAPKGASTRVVGAVWWFFTLIMVSSYTANLAAFLTVETPYSPFNNVRELAAQEKIKYGCLGSGSTFRFFESSSDDIYKKMYKFMKSQKSVFTQSNGEGVQRVKKDAGDYAYFMESSSIEYITERHCELASVGELLDTKSYGIGVRRDDVVLREFLSDGILKLSERGVLSKLKDTWWKQRRGGGQCKATSAGGQVPLGLANVSGCFIVLLLGMGLSTVVAFLEFFYKTLRTDSKERESMMQEIKNELKFVFKCRGSKKPVKRRSSSSQASSTGFGGSGKDKESMRSRNSVPPN